MALIRCPECENKISEKAIFCPKCGYPLDYIRTLSESDALKMFKKAKHDSEFKAVLRLVDPNLLKDRRFLLELLKKDIKRWGIIEEMGYDNKVLHDDRDFILELVREDGKAIEYASEELKRDKSIVMEAIKTKTRAIDFIDKSLQEDKEVVIENIKLHGEKGLPKLASDTLRNDKDVIDAIRQYVK